jgi:uncharacterized protein
MWVAMGMGKGIALKLAETTALSVFIAAAFAGVPAYGAGMDCLRAASATEKAICGNADLNRRDAELSALYGKVAAAQPPQRAALRDAQRQWLKTRDACGAGADCIGLAYDSRSAALQTQLHDALAYQPDATDKLALEDLRRAVETARQADAEFPLEKALAALATKSQSTTFSNVNDSKETDSEAHFPTVKPDGVSEDEWRALLVSHVESGGENGNASYGLEDIDGDGQRDLIIDSYSGGTGLFSYISTLRRDGARFVAAQGARSDGDFGPYLYSLNGRGGNQSAYWIRLRGRVYAAYTVSYYGVSNVYLLNPLAVVGKAPKLMVRYRYRLSIPKIQRNDEKGTVTTLDGKLYAALTQALSQVNLEQAQDVGDQSKPLCPIPAGVNKDDSSLYYGYGPGHYTFEIVGDMAVHVGPSCYIGRVVDWFGGYSAKGGLDAQLWMRPPAEDGEEQQFTVHGKRAAIRVETSIADVEGDNGA